MHSEIELHRTEDQLIEAAGHYIDRFGGAPDRLLSPSLRRLRRAVKEYRDARLRGDAPPARREA